MESADLEAETAFVVVVVFDIVVDITSIKQKIETGRTGRPALFTKGGKEKDNEFEEQ